MGRSLGVPRVSWDGPWALLGAPRTSWAFNQVSSGHFVSLKAWLRLSSAWLRLALAWVALSWLRLAWLCWLGSAWLGLTWLGLAWPGLACLPFVNQARTMLLWLELWPLLCGALLRFDNLGCPKTHVAFTTITEIDRLTYTDGLRHHFSYSKVSAGREASPEHSIRLLFSTL